MFMHDILKTVSVFHLQVIDNGSRHDFKLYVGLIFIQPFSINSTTNYKTVMLSSLCFHLRSTITRWLFLFSVIIRILICCYLDKNACVDEHLITL